MLKLPNFLTYSSQFTIGRHDSNQFFTAYIHVNPFRNVNQQTGILQGCFLSMKDIKQAAALKKRQ